MIQHFAWNKVLGVGSNVPAVPEIRRAPLEKRIHGVTTGAECCVSFLRSPRTSSQCVHSKRLVSPYCPVVDSSDYFPFTIYLQLKQAAEERNCISGVKYATNTTLHDWTSLIVVRRDGRADQGGKFTADLERRHRVRG